MPNLIFQMEWHANAIGWRVVTFVDDAGEVRRAVGIEVVGDCFRVEREGGRVVGVGALRHPVAWLHFSEEPVRRHVVTFYIYWSTDITLLNNK